jgi:hypothetical protein
MERMNEDGQWIVLMGFMVCAGIFFLAVIISQAPLVGQTTSEGVLEFPKTEIQDLHGEIAEMSRIYLDAGDRVALEADIKALAMARQNAVVDYTIVYRKGEYDLDYDYSEAQIHYHNGITEFDGLYVIPIAKQP